MLRHRIHVSCAISLLALAASCSSGSTTSPTSPTSSSSQPAEADTTAPDTAAVGPTDPTPGTTSATVEPSVTDAPPSSNAPPIDERIVVLGQEALLADLLALGITPVAATANVEEVGFLGLDAYDTSAIEVLPGLEINLERLALLEPDRLITTEFFAEEIGRDVLEQLAELTVLPDGLSAEELIAEYGALFDRMDQAEAMIAELEAARATAATELAGLVASVVAIYPGPSVAAFVEGPWSVPATLISAGVTLVPAPDEAEPDRNGRAFLSMEQLGLITGPQLILLQNEFVEGENDAIEQMNGDPLWQRVAAVAAGEVTVLDRLGYWGVDGEIRLIDDLIEALT
jgi:ABC-type Fe3+-hydroxamate transport system substrate-binding protein